MTSNSHPGAPEQVDEREALWAVSRLRLRSGRLRARMVAWSDEVRMPGGPGKPGTGSRPGMGHDTAGLILMSCGLLAGLWLLAGWLAGPGPAYALWALFGIGAPVLALALFIGGFALWLADRFGWQPHWWAVVAAEVLFFVLLTLTQLSLGLSRAAALHGEGGGFVGWAIARFLVMIAGPALAWLVTLAFGVAGIVWLWRSLPQDWTARASESGRVIAGDIKQRLSRGPQPGHGSSSDSSSPGPASSGAPDVAQAPRQVGGQTARSGQTAAAGGQPAAAGEASRRKSRRGALPPMDLLDLGADRAQGGMSADARQQAQILQQTLAEFGVPVEVVSVKEGPTVTQFGLEPGEFVREMADGEIQRRRVTVNRILRLSNDLALALAAPSIRIEAPVPGRPYVGVEIPNPRKTLVALRPVLESKTYTRADSALAVALGRDVAGDPVVADLARMPHLLIAGATGSGKSVCINAIIASLLMSNRPETLRFLMIDPKMVELPVYNGIPHLLAPVVTDTSQATGALAWLTLQMDERYRLFARHGVRNIEEYNRAAGKGRSSEPLPYLVLVIDELADLMMTAAYDVERQICRLAQMARATGIHLVLATQRPSVDVITGLIKANFPARIAFAVATQIDSRVILDGPGAEKLLGRGDMLFMMPDASKLLRVQGCFVSDREIDRLVDYWKASRPAGDEDSAAPLPWAGLLDQMEERDDLLEKAIQMIQGKQQVSTSLLQRQLRIGYPRAARLMEQLEAMGQVGPDEGGGRSRQVLIRPDDQNEIE